MEEVSYIRKIKVRRKLLNTTKIYTIKGGCTIVEINGRILLKFSLLKEGNIWLNPIYDIILDFRVV